MKALVFLLAGAIFATYSASDSRSQDITTDPQLTLDAKGFSDPVYCLAISNDGRWLAGAAEKVVRVWDLKSGELHATLRGYQEPLGYHVGQVRSITFSPDSNFLVVAVSDNFEAGSTRVYDLTSPEKLSSLVKGHLGCTVGATFSTNGKYLATFGCDGNLIVYDWDPEHAIAAERFRSTWRDFPSTRPDSPRCFRFSDDSDFLVFSQLGHEAAIDVQTQAAHSMTSREIPQYLSTFGARAADIQLQRGDGFKPQGGCAPAFRIDDAVSMHDEPWAITGETLTRGKESKFVARVYTNNGQPLASREHSFHITSVEFNIQANLAASADILGTIQVWDLTTGDEHHRLAAMNAPIWSVFWGSDDPNSLFFSTTNLPRGEFNYNNYGGIGSSLNLLSSNLMEISESAKLKHADTAKRRPTSVQSKNYKLHRAGELGKRDLMISDERGTRFVNPFSAVDGEQDRIDAIDDPAVRLTSRFGEIAYFAQLEHPSVGGEDTFLLGSRYGNLVEGYFDQTAYCREFRITKRYIGHTSQITGADVSTDGKLLATSSLDGTMRIWRLQQARELGDVDFLAEGTRISYIPEGSLSEIAGLQVDDVVLSVGETTYYQRIREIQRGQLLAGQAIDITVARRSDENQWIRVTVPLQLSATPDIVEPFIGFFLARDNEWVLWNDAGHYNSSSNGAQYIGWHINNARNEPATFYASDQFQQALYQPRVVSEAFRLRDSQRAAVAVLGDGAFADDLGVAVPLAHPSEASRYVPPEITIVTPARNSLVRNDLVSVRACVRLPQGADIRSVRMFINGRPHPNSLAVVRTGVAGEFQESWFEEELALGPGAHVCKLTVESSINTSASAEVRFEVDDDEQSGPGNGILGRLFVLAIGISDYNDPSLRLEFADHDAEEFAALWSGRRSAAFSKIETKTLINREASVNAIKINGLNWLLDQDLDSRDTVILLLSGHGFFDRYDEWYFGGCELDLDRLSVTGISDAELTSFFRKLPTNTIMFLDSCYAGQFRMPKQVAKNSRTGKNPWRGEGKIVFSSCLPGETSWENAEWQHGAFTKAVLDYFSDPNADYNGDGELGCLEMIQYVQDRVRKMTNQTQNPAVEFPSGISDVSFGPVGVAE